MSMSREQQITQIAADAKCSMRTVRRYLEGCNVIPAIEAAIKASAKARHLNLDVIRKKV